MTQGKPVTVSRLGSGKSYETVIEPGDRPRDILARTLSGKNDDAYLRAGSGKELAPDTDLYREIGPKEVLYAVRDPVVGGSPGRPIKRWPLRAPTTNRDCRAGDDDGIH